jgi:hypothetical protein
VGCSYIVLYDDDNDMPNILMKRAEDTVFISKLVDF